MSQIIYLASGNAHKLKELQSALDEADLAVQVFGPDEIGGMPEVEETGSTFEANALLKAYGLQSKGPEDGWYLADDSGLEVDALDGRPGVISARYAGEPCDDEANNDKVLEEMEGKQPSSRACRFRCVLALVGKGIESTFSGSCEGPYWRNAGEMVALDMTHSSCPMKAPPLLQKFRWRKKRRSATGQGH